MSSNKITAIMHSGEKLSNGELEDLIKPMADGSLHGVEADVFTYGGRTLILTYPAEPIRDRFSPKMRIKRKSRTR